MSGRLDEVTPPPLDFPLLLPLASQHLSTKGPPDRQSSHLASPLRFDVGGLARSLGPNRPQHLRSASASSGNGPPVRCHGGSNHDIMMLHSAPRKAQRKTAGRSPA